MNSSLRHNTTPFGWLLTLCVVGGFLMGCGPDGDDKAPYRPAIWGEAPAPEKMWVSPDPLSLDGDRRQGRFEDAPFQGYLVYGGAYTVLDVDVVSTEGQGDPVVMVYGPRRDGNIWGRHVAFDDDGGIGNSAVLTRVQLPELGEYLVLVTSFDGRGQGGYELSLECAGGCNAPACEVMECHADGSCQGRFLNDARGCRSCQCVARCQTSADCGASQICVDGQCVDDCACTGDLEQVCGADGVTYANSCEARCQGVEVVSLEACADECPEFSCNQLCADGYVLDTNGCPTCVCKSPCDRCDERVEPVCTLNGRTYTNACEAECRGEKLAYAGACDAQCVWSGCEVECEAYQRNADGCPMCTCSTGACPQKLEPVCGINGVTYNNLCEAERAGVEVVFDDICPPTCQQRSDCPSGFACRPLGGREELCEQDPEAQSPCVGVCVPPETPQQCSFDSECRPGHLCADGQCRLPCNCSPVYNPVCGADGQTYNNPCEARCAQQPVTSVGACCPSDSLDGCGVQCENGFAVDGDGCEICACREAPPCECQPVENPVCGADDQTYLNPCEAQCAGVQWVAGVCR